MKDELSTMKVNDELRNMAVRIYQIQVDPWHYHCVEHSGNIFVTNDKNHLLKFQARSFPEYNPGFEVFSGMYQPRTAYHALMKTGIKGLFQDRSDILKAGDWAAIYKSEWVLDSLAVFTPVIQIKGVKTMRGDEFTRLALNMLNNYSLKEQIGEMMPEAASQLPVLKTLEEEMFGVLNK